MHAGLLIEEVRGLGFEGLVSRAQGIEFGLSVSGLRARRGKDSVGPRPLCETSKGEGLRVKGEGV